MRPFVRQHRQYGLRWHGVRIMVALGLVLAACSGTETATAPETPTAPAAPTTTAPAAQETPTSSAPGTSVDSDALDRIYAAQQATSNAEAARFVIEQQIDGASEGQALSAKVEGAIDFQTSRLRMTMDAGAVTGMSGETVEMFVDEDVIYMNSPQLGDQWIALPQGSRAIDQDVDPTRSLEQLTDAALSAQEVGQEEVRGVQTTRYDLVIDLQAALDNAEGNRREEIQAQIDSLGSTELPTSLWIDDDNLIRRQQNELVITDETGGDVTVNQVIEFFDYGADLDLTPPENVMEMPAGMMGLPTEG